MSEIHRTAVAAIVRVWRGQNLTQVLSAAWQAQPSLPPQARAAAQDMSYGVLRHQRALEWLLGALAPRPVADAEVRALLLGALYQLRQGRTAAHAAVNLAVGACAALRKPAARGFVNAVLRNYLRRRDALETELAAQPPAVRHSHPDWLATRLDKQYPGAAEEILAANNAHPPMTLRVNVRRVSPADYAQRLSAAGIDATPLGGAALRLARPAPVTALPGFGDGCVSVQDFGAQQAAAFLAPAAGSRVLDACAAPGGKTAHLLETTDCRVTALDADAARLARVNENLGRLGLSADVRHGDAAVPAEWWDGVPYDAILADVPCSATGVIRRHPDIKRLRRPEDIAAFAAQQAAILDQLWQCLAVGGKLLYATCSVLEEENQLQIARFLDRHANAVRLALPGHAACDVQYLPNENHDGFYYALLCKR